MKTAEELKFSVILPVYNMEHFLQKCLDSIVNQTLKDFEIICVNDGSTDRSPDILREYADKDSRFVIIEQENQGQGAARNNALSIAKGKYIVFADPDDWIEPNALEEIYNAFQAVDTEVVEFNYYYHSLSGEIKPVNLAEHLKILFDYDFPDVPFYNKAVMGEHCLSKLFRQVWSRAYTNDFIKRTGSMFSRTRSTEDNLFAIATIVNASNIYYLNKYLYHQIQRENSAENNVSDIHFAVFDNIKDIKDYLITHNFYEEMQEAFKHYILAAICCRYPKIPKRSRRRYKKIARQYLSVQDYKNFIRNTKAGKLSPIQVLFSVRNEYKHKIKRKVITFFGIKLKIKTGKPLVSLSPDDAKTAAGKTFTRTDTLRSVK